MELTPDFVCRLSGPVNLIVPDASWRQTKKFVRRELGLVGIPHVRLPPGPLSVYRLRAQRFDQNLCALEAIARAIGILGMPHGSDESGNPPAGARGENSLGERHAGSRPMYYRRHPSRSFLQLKIRPRQIGCNGS